MKKYYFTFGMSSVYHKRFVVIESDSYSNARIEMFNRFGNKWAFQYTEDEWYIKKSDPKFLEKCRYNGIDPDSVNNEGISQKDLYNLTELK